MKKREKRRHLTEKYLRKQLGIYNIGANSELDVMRHFQTERARRHYFVCWLSGNITDLSGLSPWEIGLLGIPYRHELTPKQKGRLRRQSYLVCGCKVCRFDKLYRPSTLREQRANEAEATDLAYYVIRCGPCSYHFLDRS